MLNTVMWFNNPWTPPVVTSKEPDIHELGVQQDGRIGVAHAILGWSGGLSTLILVLRFLLT